MGDKEVENNAIAVRTRSGEDLGTMSVDDFIAHLDKDIETKGKTH